jgi:hypothetical protein
MAPAGWSLLPLQSKTDFKEINEALQENNMVLMDINQTETKP